MQGRMYCYTVTIDGIVVLYNLYYALKAGNCIVEVTVRLLSNDLLAAHVSCGYCHGTCNGYDQQMYPMTL